MKRVYLSIFLIFYAINVFAGPPAIPPAAGLTDAKNVTIGGGTINGTTVGDTTPAAGTFTTARWAKGADIASATTTNLATATGNVIDITGTTTIAGFGTVAAGATFYVRFTGSLTLTYNATSMILPGARDITTEAGDRAVLVSLGSGNWLCHEFLKANGLAIGVEPTYQITSTRNLASYEMRGQVAVITGAYTPSMPSAVVGNNVTFVNSTANVYSADVAVGTDIIILNGTALAAAGNKVTSDGTLYNVLHCRCFITGYYSCTSNGAGLHVDGGN